MTSNVSITITGHLADEPKCQPTKTGKLVTNFVVIANDRMFDRDRNEWVDVNKTIIRVNCWGPLAETVADSLSKGSRVTVTGHRLIADAYLGQDSKPRAGLDLTADTVAVDLKGQKAQITRLGRTTANDADNNEPPF
ncbi:single-stranded DNA-binding protein [Nocardia concava]|uniref:single-stranded DNA-binding protein n=1 Tax=Nocardia concava TaxID=257281 RepID=UPI0002FFC0C3|nr:single-stranded DNA-binding protein [Nocardia concava]